MKIEIEVPGFDVIIAKLVERASIDVTRIKIAVIEHLNRLSENAGTSLVVLLDNEPTIWLRLDFAGGIRGVEWWGTNVTTAPDWDTTAAAFYDAAMAMFPATV